MAQIHSSESGPLIYTFEVNSGSPFEAPRLTEWEVYPIGSPDVHGFGGIVNGFGMSFFKFQRTFKAVDLGISESFGYPL